MDYVDSRATKDDDPFEMRVAKAIALPCGDERGIEMLESFGFRRREILHRNVEIFAVGKIAEFARFAGGERRKSPVRCCFNRAERA